MLRSLLRHSVLPCLVLFALPPAVSAANPAADEVAARVDGTIISRESVRAVAKALANAQETPPDAKRVEQITRDALDSLIAFELLYQESQRRGLTVSDADIDASIQHVRARFANQDAYAAALKQRGMTPEDMRRDTRKTLAVNLLLEQTAWKDLQIKPEQIQQFYDQNRAQFKHPAEIRASHILIRVPAHASAEEKAKARKEAEGLLGQLKGGADFAALARQHSQDPATAAKGGDLGFFARDTMADSFEKAAFALKPGELSGVVETPYGFDLIKVTGQREAGYTPLDDVKGEIVAVLRDEEKRHRQDQLVAELRKKAKVEILPLLKPTEPPKR
jgi:peptidyl-prolyl cis-trans isomerase C